MAELVDRKASVSRARSEVSAEEARVHLARLAALADPAFSTSADWPRARSEGQSIGPPDDRWYSVVTRYANGNRVLEVDVRDAQGASCTWGEVRGLAADWRISVKYDWHEGTLETGIWLHLPGEIAERVLAAFASP